MADKMLIDASHEEETRVVVVRGNRIEEFDFESQHKKQLRGNIYLAKVTRVEPSLQAAFVDYGGNRHGFLAFSEIHPDYYQIPVADRQALIEAEAAEARAEDDDEDEKTTKKKSRTRRTRGRTKKAKTSTPEAEPDLSVANDTTETPEETPSEPAPAADASDDSSLAQETETSAAEAAEDDAPVATGSDSEASEQAETDEKTPPDTMAAAIDRDEVSEAAETQESSPATSKTGSDDDDDDDDDDSAKVESVGADDALEEVLDRSRKPRKQYRIQEVIKRRQILLVQVVKEERGNKGAALTTYLSLAGRYSVLMPNTARGGGISRKITNVQDRKRLKEIARGLEVPQGMGVILRTAGANRTKAEIKRDFEYLMRLWDNVRNLTLKSTAPCLVYEEGSLIKRSIRDLYNKDIGEVIVSGDTGYREAKDFMKMLMPSHAKVVQPYREIQPIFTRSGIEAQLDRMLQPQVTLKSGGYIIINQTEALVAIDVNSGRSTKEHSIEDTALRTNLEAAEEVARQLRLRDLAGLIVIDFIDMEEKRNNRSVEKKLKECLKSDRARIQVGRISHFGLLEMSRQRIRASVLESTMQICEHCEGTGHVRSASSVALYVLRSAEEYLLRNTKHNITIRTVPQIALYLLNQKRDSIIDLETRFGLTITVEADATIGQQHIAIDQGTPVASPVEIETAIQADEMAEYDAEGLDAARDDDEDGGRRRKRRRRRRGRNDDDGDNQETQAAANDAPATDPELDEDGEPRRKRRRRGKRGGRRNRDSDAEQVTDAVDSVAASDTETVEAEDTTAVAGSEGQDTPVVDSPDAEPADTEEVGAVAEPVEAKTEKPKPRKRRSTRKASEEKPAAEADAVEAGTPDLQTAADTAEEQQETLEASAVAVADAEPAPAPEPAPADGETEVVADQKPKRRRTRAAAEKASPEPKVTSTAAEPAEEAEPQKPKRVGWWQRRGFF